MKRLIAGCDLALCGPDRRMRIPHRITPCICDLFFFNHIKRAVVRPTVQLSRMHRGHINEACIECRPTLTRPDENEAFVDVISFCVHRLEGSLRNWLVPSLRLKPLTRCSYLFCPHTGADEPSCCQLKIITHTASTCASSSPLTSVRSSAASGRHAAVHSALQVARLAPFRGGVSDHTTPLT